MSPVTADFQSAISPSPHSPPRGWDLCLADPVEVLETHRLDQVSALLEHVHQAALDGKWAALALAYEAGPAFDPAMRVNDPVPDGVPLLWAALFDRPAPRPEAPKAAYEHTPWRPLVDQSAHAEAVAVIQEHIRQGETYQINYTLPLECEFSGDARAWHQDLLRAQQPGYAACLDLGRFQVLSLSPELYFQRQGDGITARPMKGTLARGRWPGEDAARREALISSAKDRAENVMITDLTRNDLGRLAVPGSVRVDSLCAPERYPTLWQLTSTVRAELKPGLGLAELFSALFPCGSITGAPKIRSMGLIQELEPHPRGFYCGAVGYVAPGGDCVFNVPIRTVVLDKTSGRARFGVGGGVTWDSSARAEYEECAVKANFLSAPAQPFQLLETLLLTRGRLAYLEEHLARMAGSAEYFGFDWNEGHVLQVLEALVAEHPTDRRRVRMLVDQRGQARVESFPLPREPRRVRRLGWATVPVDSSDPFLFHKTTRRSVYDKALASCADCDDVLLTNEQGQVTESCLANVVVRLDGKLWTPAQECGLLPGVLRQRLLDRGLLRERVLTPGDLARAERVWLINSVRGFMDAKPAPRR